MRQQRFSPIPLTLPSNLPTRYGLLNTDKTISVVYCRNHNYIIWMMELQVAQVSRDAREARADTEDIYNQVQTVFNTSQTERDALARLLDSISQLLVTRGTTTTDVRLVCCVWRHMYLTSQEPCRVIQQPTCGILKRKTFIGADCERDITSGNITDSRPNKRLVQGYWWCATSAYRYRIYLTWHTPRYRTGQWDFSSGSPSQVHDYVKRNTIIIT